MFDLENTSSGKCSHVRQISQFKILQQSNQHTYTTSLMFFFSWKKMDSNSVRILEYLHEHIGQCVFSRVLFLACQVLVSLFLFSIL